MSEEISKAWYRKYRPVTMEDYMGDDIKYTVENRFTVPENRPNVFMLHGNRGCGKTSFARINTIYVKIHMTVNHVKNAKYVGQ